MPHISGIAAEGWSLLQKPVRIPLDKWPLLIIRGRNLNSGDPRQSNAAGKSMLMSVLPTIAFSAPPVATKKQDLSGMQEGSKLTLDFKDGDQWRIEQAYTKKLSYKILRNGKDQKVRTTPLARKRIAELLPWSPEVFYSTVYLDGRRPFKFQMGSDSERLAFFTSMFHLHEYGGLHKQLLARRLKLQENAVRGSTLEAELVRQIRARDESGWSKAKAIKWESIAAETAAMQTAWAEANRKTQRLTPLIPLWQKQQELDKLCANKPASSLEIIKKQVKRHRAWDEYEEAEHDYTTSRKRLLKQLSKLPEHRSVEAVEEDLSKVANLLGRLERDIEDITEKREAMQGMLESMRGVYSEAEAVVKKLPDVPTENLDAEELAGENHRLNSLRKLADLVDSGHKKCPTCGSKLDAKNVRTLVAAASKKIQAVQAGLRRLEAVSRMSHIVQEGKKLRAKLSSDEMTKLSELEAKAKKLRRRRRELSQMLDAARTRSEAQARLDRIKAPKKPKKARPKITIAQLLNLYDAHLRWNDAMRSQRALQTAVEELTHKPRLLKAPDVDKSHELQRDLQKKLSKLNAKLADLQSSRERWRAARSTIQRLTKELEECQEALTDMPVLDALIAAYGNKGLKVNRAAEIATYIEKELNSKARLIFVEPTRFQCSVTEGKFGVTYTRGKRTADVQRLSGAESKAFALLLFAAYVPLVPSHLRTNLLVLDEMDANMSAATKHIFIHDFLPYLQSLVPNIVVVTPDNETHYPHAKVLTVVKKGEESIVEGL